MKHRWVFAALLALSGCDSSTYTEESSHLINRTYALESDLMPLFGQGQYVLYDSQLTGLEMFSEPFNSRLAWVSTEKAEGSVKLQHQLFEQSDFKWLNSDWIFVPWSKGWQIDRMGGYSAQDLNSPYLPIFVESPLFAGKWSTSVMKLQSNIHHSPIYGYAEIEVETQQEITGKHWVSTPMGKIQCYEMHYQQQWKPNKPARITDDQFEGTIKGDICLHPKVGFVSYTARFQPKKPDQPELVFKSILKRTNIPL